MRGEWRSRLGAFGLTLLPLLVFVLRGGLSSLKRLLHILCRLVGGYTRVVSGWRFSGLYWK